MTDKIELCGTYMLRQLKTEDKSSEEVMYSESKHKASTIIMYI